MTDLKTPSVGAPKLEVNAVTSIEGAICKRLGRRLDRAREYGRDFERLGIEMLHFAFLLHEEVIDRDFRRRERSNLLGAVREPSLSAALSMTQYKTTTYSFARQDDLLEGPSDIPAATRELLTQHMESMKGRIR